MPQIDKMAPVGSRPVGCWALQLQPAHRRIVPRDWPAGVVLTHYKRKQESLSPARLAFRKGQQVEHSLARKIGRPIEGGLNTIQLANQPTSAIRSWAAASAAVAGCAGSWRTVAS